MNPALTLSFPSSSFNNCAFHPFPKPQFLPLPNAPFRTTPGDNPPLRKFAVWSSSSSSSSSSSGAADSVPCFDVPVPTQSPLLQKIKAFAKSSVLIAATVSFVIRVNETSVARAEVSSPPPTVVTEELPADVGGKGAAATLDARQDGDSVLHEFLESNPESLDYLKKLLQQQLEAGEDREALTLLEQIVSAHPGLAEYKILLARLYNELGETVNARRVFDDILADNPLSFEALFENSLLMDRCGEGETVISRLEEAVKIAEDEGKKKEARDVRLIIAQMEFLRKDVEGALRSYEELIKDDVSDFRPYFCKGMIFSLVGKDDEAKEMFKKYKELSPRKFDVEGYIRSPLSRVKVFGTNETN